MKAVRSFRSLLSVGCISSASIRSISAIFCSLRSIVLSDAAFFVSYIRVPAASSTIERVSRGFILRTLVILPCMMRKCGLFTLSWTEWKKFSTRPFCALWPLMRYFDLPPMATCLVTVISSWSRYPTGLDSLSELSKTIETVALVMPAWPFLYTRSIRFFARTCDRLVMPSTKQIASRMFDLPDPFKPVMALNMGSNCVTCVRLAYDLKPSSVMLLTNIVMRLVSNEAASQTVRNWSTRTSH
mmetsp:Transcript_20953/g.54507  ORF Transcript_20953/g.54507 Transcript_20953/m.54507 type:complete len:242 (-) Transcript_20953:99-824(-)